MRVEWGSLVELDYDLLLDSGRQVDSSAGSGPLRLRVGEWSTLPGLGAKLVGLTAGDERLLRLPPREAFGEWDPAAVMTLRESHLVGSDPLEDGATLYVEAQGRRALCRYFRLPDRDRVALDFNHPLAGEPLTMFVQVREVRPPSRAPQDIPSPRIPPEEVP